MRYLRLIFVIIIAILSGELSGQWLTGYSHRNKIEIITGGVSGSQDLLDFPLLVSMSGPELRTVANGGELLNPLGKDIRFTTEDGTLLDFDLEFHSVTTGNLVTWLRIPGLSNTANFNIYVYYGNSSVDTYPPFSEVWSSDYRGVWHMSFNTNDASSYLNNGTDFGTTSMDGKIGLSRGFDGVDDRVVVPYSSSLAIQDNLSIEAWLRYTNNDDLDNGLVTKLSAYELWYAKDHLMFIVAGGSIEYPLELEEDRWYHICATYDRSNQRLFLNGTEVSSLPNTTQISDNVSVDVGFGHRDGQATSELTGDLDEVRVLSKTVSADWIRTSYRNQDNPAAFSSYISTEIRNDLPCNATLINVNAPCSSNIFSNTGATDSGISLSECSGYAGSDTWFKVVVPVSGNLIVNVESGTSPGWLRQPGLAVYSGTCDNLSYDTCWIDPVFAAPHLTPEFTFSGYTPGDTLFLRVWGYNNTIGKFRICALAEEDVEAPTILCPENINTPADPGVCAAELSIAIPITDDNYGVASVVNDYNGSGDASDTYPVDTSTVEWTVTDFSGNMAVCSHLVIVSDTAAPLISCLSDRTVIADSNCEFVIPDYADSVSVIDHCDPNPTIIQSPVPGTRLLGSGTIQEIIFSAEDNSGNISICSFNLTLMDNTPPEAISLNDTSVIVPEGVFQTFINVPVPVFTDNCGLQSVSNDFNGGTDASGIYPYGTTTVVYTVSDINSNTVSFNQQVQVEFEDEPDHGLVIPEAFSPNEDGLNDRFEILGLEQYPENELQVYNVHGIEVFRMADYDNSWDGSSQGKVNNGNKLPTGTYYYMLELNPGDSIIKGYLYLRRE